MGLNSESHKVLTMGYSEPSDAADTARRERLILSTKYSTFLTWTIRRNIFWRPSVLICPVCVQMLPDSNPIPFSTTFHLIRFNDTSYVYYYHHQYYLQNSFNLVVFHTVVFKISACIANRQTQHIVKGV